MAYRVGTSGYSCKERKGSFYPEKTPPKDMLRHYAERLGVLLFPLPPNLKMDLPRFEAG